MERETEHVRMMDGGRLALSFPHPLESEAHKSPDSLKFQLSQHGNVHGVSLFASEKGGLCCILCLFL